MNRVVELAREVVAQRLLIVAAVTGVLHLAVAVHWVSQGWSDDAISAVTGAVDGLGTVVAGVVIRKAVTPSKDPRDNDGNRLISVAVHEAALAAARNDAHAAAAAADVPDVDDSDIDWPDETEHQAEHAAPDA